MRTIRLTGAEFLLIELAVCRSVAAAVSELDRFQSTAVPVDPDDADELVWLIAWAETSVSQQREALTSLRTPLGSEDLYKPNSP
jgi:hypothetical protein